MSKAKEDYKKARDEKRLQIAEAYNKLQKRTPNKPITVLQFHQQMSYGRYEVEHYFGGMKHLRAFVKDRWPNSINYDVKEIRNFNTTKNDLLKWYCEIYNKIGGTPSRKMVIEDARFTVDMINNHYGSIIRLEEVARNKYPSKFEDVTLDSLKTLTKINKMNEAVQKYKKFVITTAVAGCKPNEAFLKSIKKFCSSNNAKLLILVCEDPAKVKGHKNKKQKIHKSLMSETVVLESLSLNSNLVVSNIKMQAKAIKPTTGFGRIAKKNGSQVYASPKIFLEYNSVRNNKYKLPHFIATTGAITEPDYMPPENFYSGLRTAEFAESDHKLGAFYVEIEDDEKYHFTQIECKSSGGEIFFRNKMYKGKEKPKVTRAEAFIMGDLHSGVSDPEVTNCWSEVIKLAKPKRIAIHDGFNGTSVNGHIENDIIAKINRATSNKDDLEAELIGFFKDLEYWSKMCDELDIVPSNHNDWLERWLRKGSFIKEGYKNAPLAFQIVSAMIDKDESKRVTNPIKYAFDLLGFKLNNINWHGRNDDVIIEGIQINCHGDVGKNGSRGSLASMVSSYIASFSGHTHTAGIIFDAWGVGTSTYLQECYNNGPGTWTNTSGLIYKYGNRALVNSIGGKWRI